MQRTTYSRHRVFGLALGLSLWCGGTTAASLADPKPPSGYRSAAHAVSAYSDAMVRTLGDLVTFATVHVEGQANQDQPAFREMTAYLQRTAEELGLDFTDAGAVVVIGLGEGRARLGLVTHGDVQPADPTKWTRSPFSLDAESQPGLLVARGAEDDKGPIAAALYAMKAVKDLGLPLERRVELIVSYTEESDWTPFTDYLAQNPPPDLNVALDAVYPVMVAEKGWVGFRLRVGSGAAHAEAPVGPVLESLEGGVFLSQVPEDAVAVIRDADDGVAARLRATAEADSAVTYSFERTPTLLTVRARGVSAHSAEPWEGVNAITHLAEVLATTPWPPSPAAHAVQLIHDLIGPGYEAERFGSIAHRDEFMGPLTLSLGIAATEHDAVSLGINLRRPIGKTAATLESEIRAAVAAWQQRTHVPVEIADLLIYEPYDARQAPHVPVLLDIFRGFTGQTNAQPVSMGGGTHARLVPHGVNFGPAMPGQPYTGHTENEYVDRAELLLTLQMYAAMIERLACR